MCIGTIGRLTKVWLDDGVPMGRIRTGAREETACLLYFPDAQPGDSVLAHLGFVTEILDPARAAQAEELRAQIIGEESP